MNIFVQLQKVLLGKRHSEKLEKTTHILLGAQYFQALLETAETAKEKEDTLKARNLYRDIVEKMKSPLLQSSELLHAFLEIFIQINGLLLLASPHKRLFLQDIQRETASLAVHYVYAYTKSISFDENTFLQKAFHQLLTHIPAGKVTGIKMRYLARRAHEIRSQKILKGTEIFEEIIHKEITKYCLLFDVQDISLESAFTLGGFIVSLAKKTPGISEADFEKIKENIGKKTLCFQGMALSP